MSDENVKILLNPIDLPYCYITYYISSGMSDDIFYSQRGIAHLTEHVIIEEFIRLNKDLIKNVMINGSVDKEYTCFEIVTTENSIDDIISNLFNLISLRQVLITDNIVNAQIKEIYDIENNRNLANTKLLNVLALEQKAFTSKLSIPTLVDESFKLIDRHNIISYIRDAYTTNSHYLVITGRIPLNYISSNRLNLRIQKKEKMTFVKGMEYPINYSKISNEDDINTIVAIIVDQVKCSTEYFELKILCRLYQILIYNRMKDCESYIIDVSFKIYDSTTILMFNYSKGHDSTLSYLREIEKDDMVELYESLYKYTKYQYIKVCTDPCKMNKEIYKFYRYFHEELTFNNMLSLYENVKLDGIWRLHNVILNGRYISLTEDTI